MLYFFPICVTKSDERERHSQTLPLFSIGDAPHSRVPAKAKEKLKTSIASRALLCYYNKVAAERGYDKKYQAKDMLTR